MRRLASYPAMVGASVIAAVALFEVALRIAGFRFDVAPESIEFGWPNPQQMAAKFAPDPDLFWVPTNYPQILDRISERGAHIVFAGDSCVAVGQYPKLLVDRLTREHPELEFRAMKVGVSGWSSYQGLRQLERDVLPAHPRIVVVQFGWNDHWVGFGIEDKEIQAIRVTGVPGLASLRTAQLVFKGLIAWRARSRGDRPNRVSAADFEQNLRQMARLSRENGTIPVFLTAPTSHEVGREPEYLGQRYLRDLRELVPLHREYADIVREVAATENALLCDVAQGFEALSPDERRLEYFRRDGIHLRKKGDEMLADHLYDCLAASDEVSQAWVPLRSPATPDRRAR